MSSLACGLGKERVRDAVMVMQCYGGQEGQDGQETIREDEQRDMQNAKWKMRNAKCEM